MAVNLGVPYKSEAVDISSTNHTFILKVQAIYCGGAGTVVARLRGDSVDSTWEVTAGQYLHGDFTVVTRTGTDASLMVGVRYWSD